MFQIKKILWILFLPAIIFGGNGWKIHDNGSFDLQYENLKITNCYPAIDHQPINPLVVKIKKNQITYMLKSGKLRLTLDKKHGDYTIDITLEDFKVAPDWILPLAFGEIEGADRFYKQGFGFAGASGIFTIPEPKQKIERARLKEDVWSYDSYLFTGLLAENDATIVISAYDHKDYLHRSTLYNRQQRIGLIDRHKDRNLVLLETGFGMEKISLNNQTTKLPTIYIKSGNRPYETFQQQAEAIAKYNHIDEMKAPRYYFCSWYEYHKDFSQEILMNMLAGIEESEIKPEFQTIQIDDGYACYGDWLTPTNKFPNGLQFNIDLILDHGYAAGIWVAPFMVSSCSFIFKEHKDWLLRDKSGKIIQEWDNPDEDVYVLDASHPEALAYLRKVFRTFREMGITTFKTDFMDWGLRDSQIVSRYTNGKTSVQYFVEVLDMIREEIGEESFWLGCISPYQPMIGYVNGMRLSNDVGAEWSRESTVNMFREMSAGQFFNNILWQNDPDVLYLRDENSKLSEDEKQSIALFDGMMGGMLTTSCRFHTLEEQDKELWKFLKPENKPLMATIHHWANPSKILVLEKYYPDSNNKSIMLLNTSNNPLSIAEEIEKIITQKYKALYKWDNGNMIKTKLNRIPEDLSPHASQVIFLSKDGRKLETINNIKDK
ncbi:MAG: alpha-galactosidase [Fidelibacterota bacterium]